MLVSKISLSNSRYSVAGGMVSYESDQLFPFPRERVWKLLNDHLDDAMITKIHPLVQQSRTISRDSNSVVFERMIDARGKILSSQWKITSRPPDTYRWDIVTSNGPYTAGSWMQSTYHGRRREHSDSVSGRAQDLRPPIFLPTAPDPPSSARRH